MWCKHCQADVAGQASADHSRVTCSTCGAEITQAKSIPSAPAEGVKDPKELLARWASDEILDPYGPVTNQEKGKAASSPIADAIEADFGKQSQLDEIEGSFAMSRTLPLTTDELAAGGPAKPKKPPEEPRSSAPTPSASPEVKPVAPMTEKIAAKAETQSAPVEKPPVAQPQQQAPKPTLSIAKETNPAPVQKPRPAVAEKSNQLPPVNLSAPLPKPTKRRGGGLMLLGQIMAYGGVLGITIGATIVLKGYFGTQAEQAPMGWLLLTVSQLFLFLGITTLVTGGLEQTTSTVEAKFDVINSQVLHLERLIAASSQETPKPKPESHSTRPGAAA